jgi:hypothetical protein
MCIDTVQSEWILYFNDQEKCRRAIPTSQFPCRLAINGHSGCRFQLLPDEPLPDSLSTLGWVSNTCKTQKLLDSKSQRLYTESSAQVLILRMVHKCCVDAVLERMLSLAQSESFNSYHSIVAPLVALKASTRDTCIEFLLKIISTHRPKGFAGSCFIEDLAALLFEGCDALSPHAASISSRLCAVATSCAFSTSRKSLDVLSSITQLVTEKSSKVPGIYKCSVPMWCVNSLAPERGASFNVRFGKSIGLHCGILLDAGWANVSFGGHHFRVSLPCVSVLGTAVDSFGRSDETFEISFLEQQTGLPADIVRSACKQLVQLGLFEFLHDHTAVRLALNFNVNHGNVERLCSAQRTSFTSQYTRLVQHLFKCFEVEKKGFLDEVLFTFEAVSNLSVDSCDIGYFLCDLERKGLIRRSRGYLYPFYNQIHVESCGSISALMEIFSVPRQPETCGESRVPVSHPVEVSVLQAALNDLSTFEPIPETSWLLSIVLFVPDQAIDSPYPWTSAVTAGSTVPSMDAFCRHVAPILIDICKQNSRDAIYVAQVFLSHQGCIAKTLLETLARRASPESFPESSSGLCKSKEGYCLECLSENETLYTPCESASDACWKCSDCWANRVRTVRERDVHVCVCCCCTIEVICH